MTIQESKDTNINRHISTERYNESLVSLMNSIARSVYTFSYNRSLGIHSTITVDDEVFSFISCLFPLNENSIKEIDDIIGHHNFYSLREYTIKFNVDIKNILTKFANLLRDALKIAYIDAPLLTEIRS